jgi:hypothetical protein
MQGPRATVGRRAALAVALAALLPGCTPEVRTKTARERRLEALENVDLVKDYESQWRAASLCNDLADEDLEHFDNGLRREYAKRGLEHAERAIKLRPSLVEGHFYKMLCLGRYLGTFTTPEAVLVADLRDEGERTVRLDERYEYAGAHRFLGIFYSECPDTGPYAYGDLEKADVHFRKALEIAGDHPENLLAYAEFQIEKMKNTNDEVRKLLEDARDAADKHPGLAADDRESFKRKAAKLLEGIKKR